eukprot:gene15140-21200_t
MHLAVPAGAPSSNEDPIPAGVPLGSERELLAEFESAASVLKSLAADWQVRIATMARVEGIVSTNPGMMDAITEGFKMLKIPFSVQLEDRRSSVSKRSCQSLSAIAGFMGLRFTDSMLHFLPVLFTVLPITVKVMPSLSAIAGFMGLRFTDSMLHFLPVLFTVLPITVKNNKIRQFCAKYLWQVHHKCLCCITWPGEWTTAGARGAVKHPKLPALLLVFAWRFRPQLVANKQRESRGGGGGEEAQRAAGPPPRAQPSQAQPPCGRPTPTTRHPGILPASHPAPAQPQSQPPGARGRQPPSPQAQSAAPNPGPSNNPAHKQIPAK